GRAVGGRVLPRSITLKPRSIRRSLGLWPEPRMISSTISAAGVILITLLQSILSVMQMPEFGRQIIYGLVVIVMLLLCGRERLVR
ncbi:MAG: hypothetical protein NUV72_10840, partial [Bauldia sp.]|nr:hypothetical protein [Bauldia sp.]